ncbi:hypothetical protein V6N13_069889 [Hibiscus sabdariffa]
MSKRPKLAAIVPSPNNIPIIDLSKLIEVSLGLKGDVFEEMFGVAVQAGKGSSVGLQILKDRKWVPVQPIPIPNALVINIGDTIEALRNGRYKSVEHRAVTQKEQDHLSIVASYAPSYELELGPMAELVDEKSPCRYRRYNHGDYSKHYVNNKLQNKRTLEFAKIEPKTSI